MGKGGTQASDVVIVVPAFNEAEAVGGVISSLCERLPGIRVLVVDDGSQDATVEVSRRAGAEVICHRRNRGYGASLRTGIRKADREFVLFCDADGQHSVDDVEVLISEAFGFEMVVGVRGRDSHVPLVRRPGKWVLGKFANYLAGEKIPDINSGLRIMRRETILRYLHLMPDGFSFSTTSTFAFLKTRRDVKWIPIKVQRRTGKSTVRQVRHGLETPPDAIPPRAGATGMASGRAEISYGSVHTRKLGVKCGNSGRAAPPLQGIDGIADHPCRRPEIAAVELWRRCFDQGGCRTITHRFR